MRTIDADELKEKIYADYEKCNGAYEFIGQILSRIEAAPTIESEARCGHWVECDYKYIEHGFIETEPNAGLCCSECRAAFHKKKMTYKQYCAACGAKMKG